jgi:hypothetical protein
VGRTAKSDPPPFHAAPEVRIRYVMLSTLVDNCGELEAQVGSTC